MIRKTTSTGKAREIFIMQSSLCSTRLSVLNQVWIRIITNNFTMASMRWHWNSCKCIYQMSCANNIATTTCLKFLITNALRIETCAECLDYRISIANCDFETMQQMKAYIVLYPLIVWS